MRLLALDTCAATCAAALYDSASPPIPDSDQHAVPSQFPSIRSENIGRGHAERLMPMIEEVMRESNVKYADLERIVVTNGPGSFTGMRVGLAVARGFALTLDIPAVGVSSLAAIAASVSDGLHPLCVALDARRGEIYYQMFNHDGAELLPPGVASLERLANLIGERPEEMRLAGDAAHELAPLCRLTESHVLSDIAAPDIRAVARLGARLASDAPPPSPIYLRAADAKPQMRDSRLLQ